MDRSMIVAASGGALVNKTPTEAMNLIANMAAKQLIHNSLGLGQMSQLEVLMRWVLHHL